ncbi:hypothetical protein AVEN_82759-1 [Araneus ventricosus]|uniref:Uncharacterized protein n=1 Tax=Araneus ventricosus TaxID=182803 RepID=A0A4Y2E8Y9_ARAVE|nr:hypothetical protein AVEN_82759-1 [Araneus ventricosus]
MFLICKRKLIDVIIVIKPSTLVSTKLILAICDRWNYLMKLIIRSDLERSVRFFSRVSQIQRSSVRYGIGTRVSGLRSRIVIGESRIDLQFLSGNSKDGICCHFIDITLEFEE